MAGDFTIIGANKIESKQHLEAELPLLALGRIFMVQRVIVPPTLHYNERYGTTLLVVVRSG
jgi:hypothetical protein